MVTISGLDSSHLRGLRLAVMVLEAQKVRPGGSLGQLGLLVVLSISTNHTLDELGDLPSTFASLSRYICRLDSVCMHENPSSLVQALSSASITAHAVEAEPICQSRLLPDTPIQTYLAALLHLDIPLSLDGRSISQCFSETDDIFPCQFNLFPPSLHFRLPFPHYGDNNSFDSSINLCFIVFQCRYR